MSSKKRKAVPDLYKPLALDVEAANSDIKLKQDRNLSKDYLSNFLKKHAPEKRQREGIKDYIKVFFIDANQKPKKFNRKPAKRKGLSSAEKKRLNIFNIEPVQQKFSLFQPLHQLWKDYMDELIQFDKISPQNEAHTETRLIRADYHGAYITVTRSKCPSMVGLSGIVVQETRNVFKIISKDDTLKTVPKENTVFTIQHRGYIFSLHGNQFVVRPSDRVTKKFKAKPTLDL